MERPYYTYAETAELLGIKLNTLYTYIWAKKLKPIQRVGMKNVFEKSYINTILKEGLPEDSEPKEDVKTQLEQESKQKDKENERLQKLLKTFLKSK